MTQEERLLVLVDVSARLPYGVIVDNPDPVGGMWDEVISIDTSTKTVTLLYDGRVFSIDNIKPYLRPMNSMTEEEKEELKHEHVKDEKLYAECLTKASNGDNSMRGKVILHFAADWCNKNHFDYRGLIEKGLALEAPEGMYKTE